MEGDENKPTTGKLYLDDRLIQTGDFAFLQKTKRDYCRQYAISKERAKKRFRITY